LAQHQQASRALVTELEADVAAYLDLLQADEVDVRTIMVDVLRLDPCAHDYAERCARLNRQVATAIERAGWRRSGRLGRGPDRRTVYRREA
jgi:hypothetical protein